MDLAADQALSNGAAIRREHHAGSVTVPMPAVATRRATTRQSRPVTFDDPLFGLIGIGHSGILGGASAHKHEQLVRAKRS